MSFRRAASAPRSNAPGGGSASPSQPRGGGAAAATAAAAAGAGPPRRMRVRAAALLVSAAVAAAALSPLAARPSRLRRRNADAIDPAAKKKVPPAAAADGASIRSADGGGGGGGGAGTGGQPPAAVASKSAAAPPAAVDRAAGTTTANWTAAKLTAAKRATAKRTAVGGNEASIADAAPTPSATHRARNETAARAYSLPAAASGNGDGDGREEGRLRRFPRYGTPEYVRRCQWLVDAVESRPPLSGNCTFFYGSRNSRPSEGVSFWITQIVSTHLLALQAGCKVLFDYGNVQIGHVIEAPGEPRLYDWTVPRRYVCEDDPNCHQIPGWHLDKKATRPFAMGDNGTASLLSPVPRYRYAYGIERFRRSDNFTVPLEKALPGFDIHDGMACSLGALVTLAPAAARYQPDLFTDILPALRDEDALVMGIYARTGWADMHSDWTVSRGKELLTDNGTATEETERALRSDVDRVVKATLAIERRFLTRRSSETQRRREFRRIVWMVATDWPDAKGWIAAKYNGTDANAAVAPDERRYPAEFIPRRVVTTRSKGTHTRRNARPGTADFAFAFLDWYLLGESDLVVKRRYSFAETAALRTAADVYQGSRHKPLLAGRCTKVVVHEVDGSIEDVEPDPRETRRREGVEACDEKKLLVRSKN